MQSSDTSTSELISVLREMDRLPPLGPGTSSCSLTDEVETLLIRHVPERQHEGPVAAGLYWYFDCLEESHRISQEIHDQVGSYWHGLMHRREPDTWNAQYWFRRVGSHPIFETMIHFWNTTLNTSKAQMQPIHRFDPSEFSLLCEKARSQPGSELEKFCRVIQREEALQLLTHCLERM